MSHTDNIKPEYISINNNPNNENISLKKHSSSEEETEEIDTRTCFQKTCGKMNRGSMRGCIFNLCILSLGCGALSFPQKMGYMSLAVAPFVIFIAGAINYWTLTILGDVGRKYKLRKYEDIVSKLFSQ